MLVWVRFTVGRPWTKVYIVRNFGRIMPPPITIRQTAVSPSRDELRMGQFRVSILTRSWSSRSTGWHSATSVSRRQRRPLIPILRYSGRQQLPLLQGRRRRLPAPHHSPAIPSGGTGTPASYPPKPRPYRGGGKGDMQALPFTALGLSCPAPPHRHFSGFFEAAEQAGLLTVPGGAHELVQHRAHLGLCRHPESARGPGGPASSL